MRVAALSSNKSPNVWPFQKYFVSLHVNKKRKEKFADLLLDIAKYMSQQYCSQHGLVMLRNGSGIRI